MLTYSLSFPTEPLQEAVVVSLELALKHLEAQKSEALSDEVAKTNGEEEHHRKTRRTILKPRWMEKHRELVFLGNIRLSYLFLWFGAVTVSLWAST